MEEVNGVTATEPTTPPVENQEPVAQAESGAPVTEPVEPQKDYASLYENAKRALKETREKEKAEREARIALEQQIQYQAPVQPEQDDEAVQRFYANEAKTNLLIMANSDPFVRDNIAELSQEIASNPLQGAEVAIQRLKASYMDTIIKSSDIERPRQSTAPSNQTATPEARPTTAVLDESLPDLQSRLDEMLG